MSRSGVDHGNPVFCREDRLPQATRTATRRRAAAMGFITKAPPRGLASVRGGPWPRARPGSRRGRGSKLMADAPTIVMNAATSRFETYLGDETAFTEYVLHDGAMVLPHTVVPPAFEGRGVGSALARAALGYARDHGLRVKPTRPLLAGYIAKHPEWSDIVDPKFREK